MLSEQSLAGAYRSRNAAEEYGSRHERSWIRRIVSRREAKIVASLLGDPPEESLLLDAACGTGRHSVNLVTRGWNTISLDASCDMIREGCSAERLKLGSVVNGSIFHLPFRDKSLSGCACLRFLHHLPDAKQRVTVLEELGRVAQGALVVSFWTGFNVQSLRRALRRRFGRRASSRYTVTLKEFKDELRQAGLKIERIRFLHRFFSETAYARLLPDEHA